MLDDRSCQFPEAAVTIGVCTWRLLNARSNLKAYRYTQNVQYSSRCDVHGRGLWVINSKRNTWGSLPSSGHRNVYGVVVANGLQGLDSERNIRYCSNYGADAWIREYPSEAGLRVIAISGE